LGKKFLQFVCVQQLAVQTFDP